MRVSEPALPNRIPLKVALRNAILCTERVAMVQTMRNMTDMRLMHALVSQIGIRGHRLATCVHASVAV